MTTTLTAALAATLLPLVVTSPAPPTQDAVARVAMKALRGDYGALKPWQAKGYHQLLAQGTRPQLFVVTGYGPWEGRQGRVRSIGGACRPGTLACNRLEPYTYVWLTRWERLFRVEDCGGSNDSRYEVRRHQGAYWADVWIPSPSRARGRCDWTPTAGRVVR